MKVAAARMITLLIRFQNGVHVDYLCMIFISGSVVHFVNIFNIVSSMLFRFRHYFIVLFVVVVTNLPLVNRIKRILPGYNDT